MSAGQTIIISDNYVPQTLFSNLKFKVNKVIPLIFVIFRVLSYFQKYSVGFGEQKQKKEKCKIKI